MHTTSAPDSDSCIGGIVTGQGYAVNIWNVFEMRGKANNTTINCWGTILSQWEIWLFESGRSGGAS